MKRKETHGFQVKSGSIDYYQSNLKLDIYTPSTQLIPSAQEKHCDSINVSPSLELYIVFHVLTIISLKLKSET